MKGLELVRLSFEQVGLPALQKEFPQLLPRMAIGLAGEGSECFGFDDAFSRDHDWGAGFCIWLEEEDYQSCGAQLQRLYDSLDWRAAGLPVRREQPEAAGRVGCISTQRWYMRYTACPQGPDTLEQWRRVPEDFLATATNGQIFRDPLGRFSSVRDKLLQFYPEDIRIKKLTARAAVMAQAGQYNYLRSIRRGETVAARMAQAEFTKAAMSLVYLLNRRYMPYYKWAHRGMKELSILSQVGDWLEQLSAMPLDGRCEKLVEQICAAAAQQLRAQGLSDSESSFLLDHCAGMIEKIQDTQLRESHIMEG